MESLEIEGKVNTLELQVDELETALKAFTKNAVTTSTSKLPLLDRAKVYVLVVYSIEAILFSYVRLHGKDAKEHPVFRELTRVKQYFEKIKSAEESSSERPNMRLDKVAASRFIKNALAIPESRQTTLAGESPMATVQQAPEKSKRKRDRTIASNNLRREEADERSTDLAGTKHPHPESTEEPRRKKSKKKSKNSGLGAVQT